MCTVFNTVCFYRPGRCQVWVGNYKFVTECLHYKLEAWSLKRHEKRDAVELHYGKF